MISLALHGGAGVLPHADYASEIAHMTALIESGAAMLMAGRSALDVVVETVRVMEESGLYIAGRGSAPNSAGGFELDASIMDGASGGAGAVAALKGFRSPVLAARAVMDRSPHVLLAGDGAAHFAASQGCEPIDDPSSWYRPAVKAEAKGLQGRLSHGTVGCVALDAQGRLAAATSTGGTFNKLEGRCGDTPIIGAGCWADSHVAVSCTGQGEYFIRAAAAAQAAWRRRYLAESPEMAAGTVIAEIEAAGGSGGMIFVDASGAIAMPFASPGMKRAKLNPDGSILSAAF